MDKRVTGITVCYNTAGLVKNAYESIRRFYPHMPMVIIDNSDRDNDCAAYVQSLASDTTRVMVPGSNLGHGPGMDLGIQNVATKYALVFDSDIVLMDDCLPKMLEMMKADSFGVGEVMSFNDQSVLSRLRLRTKAPGIRQSMTPVQRKRLREQGLRGMYELRLLGAINVPKAPAPVEERIRAIPYLHPRFHLIDVLNYRNFRPYIQHGAPCLATMFDIYKKGISERVLIDFPIERYVRHVGRGTRTIFPGWKQMKWGHV